MPLGSIWQLLYSHITCKRYTRPHTTWCMHTFSQGNPIGQSLILLEPQGYNRHNYYVWCSADALSQSPNSQPRSQLLQHSWFISHFAKGLTKRTLSQIVTIQIGKVVFHVFCMLTGLLHTDSTYSQVPGDQGGLFFFTVIFFWRSFLYKLNYSNL